MTGVRVEGLAIGDELLDGRVTDTNGSLLARELKARGVRLRRVSIVPDTLEDIVGVLTLAQGRSDVVVCSGGLGPTDDDRTRQAIAQWLGVPLERDEGSLRDIAARFALVNMTLTPNNERQADFPQGATILPNERGTAPGFMVRHPESGLRVFCLPGVPREYQWFLERQVMAEIIGDDSPSLARVTLKVFGIGESAAEHALEGIALPTGVTLGYRAHFPEIHLTMTAWEADDGQGAVKVAEAREALLSRLGRHLVAEGEETLPARVGSLLKASGVRVTTAESCTGGLIAAHLTSVPGSSVWFDAAFVTYSNGSKSRLVGVNPELLEAHGAVSRAVVIAMARGAAEAAGAEYAMAASGVAGPGGGTPDKPVGTVEVAVHSPSGTYYRHLGMRPYWGRRRIREVTAHHALALLLKILEGRVSDDPKVEFVEGGER